jgi:DNA invertase Pin-like site-specific DNA recombinase
VIEKPTKKPRAYSYARMSTTVQLLGDSLRRQVEKSQEYAAREGWELLEDDQLKDIGISAFSGANVSGGALGLFLQAIRDRKIEPGSFLIIESLDRLSRQDPWKAMGLFGEIINSGVNIVTLADGRWYTAQTQLGDLIYSIVDMSRAHEESRMKSHRISAAWENKRKNAGASKLTARCPAWLRLSADRKRFEIRQERGDLVARIFEDSAAGIGSYSITRRLNEARIPPFGNANGWSTSSVGKILTNRAVLGEFQPCRLVNGVPIPDGAPIKDYFPAIISEQLFYRVQNGRNERRIKGAGRKGTKLSNLFSGIAKCAYCKSSMAFENKGPGPKGGTYLVCGAAKRGLGCEKRSWHYGHFEASFLAFVKELDLESLVRTESDTKRRTDLDNDIAALRGKLASIEQQRERTFELCAKSGRAADFVGQKLSELEGRRIELLEDIAHKERERNELSSDLSAFYESKEQLKALLDRLQQSEGNDVYKLRAQISSRLKSLVSDIFVAPLGSAPLTRKSIEFLEKNHPVDGLDVAEHLTSKLAEERENRRYFLIGFKDGTVRGVYPEQGDPLEFEEQIISSEEAGIMRMTTNGEETIVPGRRWPLGTFIEDTEIED